MNTSMSDNDIEYNDSGGGGDDDGGGEGGGGGGGRGGGGGGEAYFITQDFLYSCLTLSWKYFYQGHSI